MRLDLGPGFSYQIDGHMYALHWYDAHLDVTDATNTEARKILVTHTQGSNDLIVYVNTGSSTTPTTTLSATSLTYGLTETLLIGGYHTATGNTGRYWNGTVRDAVVYNRVLESTEITNLMS